MGIGENRIESSSVVRNVALQSEKEIIQKPTSEVVKRKYSDNHCTNHAQHEHGNNGNQLVWKQDTCFLGAYEV